MLGSIWLLQVQASVELEIKKREASLVGAELMHDITVFLEAVSVVRDDRTSSIIRVKRNETTSLVYNVTRNATDHDNSFLFRINGDQLHGCGNAESGFVAITANDSCDVNEGLENKLQVLVIYGKDSVNGSVVTCKTGQSRNCPSDTDITVIVYDDGK